ncbi:MAG: hypothetical protein NC203_09515 [Firmicutes bacterium]|nr:hypothetical protein [[Eubacterium] siraeum]MCM1488592.1 hypothetical protein [Bacillota bacterium]
MAQIPQISGPLSGGKNISTGSNNSGPPQGGEAFSLNGVNPVQKSQAVTQKGGATASQGPAGTGGTSTGPAGVPVAKDPSMAVETLRDVFSGELLENAKLNGYTELVGEIDDLTKAIYINPDKLMNEILLQEKDNTVFAGTGLFAVLRDICAESGPETRELVANVLKSLNNAMSKDDIINAIEANIKFLGDYFGKNTTLSKSLNALYEKWVTGDPKENFEYLKSETAELMRSIEGSLQSDSRTETLVPLVIHNLSRYNTNEYMMKDAFIQLMAQIPSSSVREKLNAEFNAFVAKLLQDGGQNPEQQQEGETVNVAAEKAAVLVYLSRLAGKAEGSSESEMDSEEYRSSIILTDSKIADVLKDFNNSPTNGKDSIERLLMMLVPKGDHAGAESIRTGLNSTESLSQLVDYLNGVLEKLPDIPERQTLCDAFEDIIGAMAKNGEMPASKAHGRDSESAGMFEELLNGKSLDEKGEETYRRLVPLSDSAINAVMQSYQNESASISGRDALIQLLSLLVPQQDTDAANMMQTVVMGTDNLSDMIEFLNHVLENIPDIPERQTLCDSFESVINTMAKNQEMAAQKAAGYESETMKALTAFIEKNVNHPAIRGIDNFNASNLLQSMLNAPGVFTPLAHYIIPLQVEDTKAFGELWVDNDNTSGGKGDEEKHYHLFLTFDVEAVGRFEVDAYSKSSNLNLSVMYPKSYRNRVQNLTDKITRIAAGVGFNVQNFKTGILIKPHNLAETFPRINENRRSLDVKA